MSRSRSLTACLALSAGIAASGDALAQSVEYDVTVIGKVPGSYLTYAAGLNDHAEVVGTALFIPGGLKAWTWTASGGFVLLPPPPTIDDYGAVDITNSGVIAGDGGGDGGEIWRYSDGVYEMLGVLAGMPIPRAAGISESGSIAGTCYGTLFYNPRHSFLAVEGAPMVSVLADSEAFSINDSDQITGTAPGRVAYRITPGIGVELLPPLGSRSLTAGYSINDAGNVVGVAASTAEHSGVPFLYSDAAGMREIGSFGGRAFARDVNAHDEVVGEWEPASTRMPWVWSESRGVRFLNDAIDPGLGLRLHDVYRINDAGQILAKGRLDGDWAAVLLTPLGGGPTSYCDPPSPNSVSLGGAVLSHVSGTPGELLVLQIDGTPVQPGILYFGTSAIDVAFGCGRRCVGGSIVRSGVYFPSATSFQASLDTSSTATTPFHIQYWYRDPAYSGSCGNVFNLTNALGF